jgi:predicted patatin/cPLA2 family phospholipase
MRAVAASGALKALNRRGLHDVFDTIHGSSAGACVAAYFVTHQLDEGRAIYFEDICNRRVVNKFGILSKPAMVDTDYIANEIIGRKRKLDAEKIVLQPNFFKVVTSGVVDGKPRRFCAFKNLAEIVNVLRASLRVPGLREDGVCINGELHLDGGLVSPIAIDSAIADGATHVVVIGTQRHDDGKREPMSTFYERSILAALYGSNLAQGYIQGQAVRRSIYRNSAGSQVPLLLLARPQATAYCNWHTIDTSILLAVEQDSEVAALNILCSINL